MKIEISSRAVQGLVFLTRALLYVASWLAREQVGGRGFVWGGGHFAKQQEVERLPYLSQLSVLSPSDILFNAAPPRFVSHTLSLPCSRFFQLPSLFFECRAGGQKKKEGHAALTCDLADPFSLQTKRPILLVPNNKEIVGQFFRSAKQITQPSRYSIHN